MIQAHLHVGFFDKRFYETWFIYIYVLLQSSTIFKQKNNNYDLTFWIKIFATPNSKNIIASLGIFTIEKSALAFLLIL